MKLLPRCLFLPMCTLFFPLTTFAWNALGHMVVAQIAYEHLTPSTQKQVDALINNFHQEYPEIQVYSQSAVWPDSIRGQKIETYTHWHYIDYGISTDGSPIRNILDSDNAEWAINNIEPIVKNAKANPYERVRFLVFLTHIVGDLHQPLHSVSNITAKNPDGDKGGNLYFVYSKTTRVTLHSLWDGGVGLFQSDSTPANATTFAERFQQEYPENYFGDSVNDLNPGDWTKEAINLAKQNVYDTPQEKAISSAYTQLNQAVVEQRVTLAGYRLAKLLNSLFNP